MNRITNLIKKSLLCLVALAAIASSSAAFAGRSPGRADHLDRVSANSTDTYTETFHGGMVAQVTVIGDGDTDLDLYVYDEFGNLVASDDDSTDACIAQWVPRWSGRFTIRIVNLGGVYNQYRLQTN